MNWNILVTDTEGNTWLNITVAHDLRDAGIDLGVTALKNAPPDKEVRLDVFRVS